MDPDARLIALPATILPSGCSGECVFLTQLANGETYLGVGSRCFCDEISNLVAARIIEPIEPDQWAVEVPDGKVIAVDRSQVRPRPFW